MSRRNITAHLSQNLDEGDGLDVRALAAHVAAGDDLEPMEVNAGIRIVGNEVGLANVYNGMSSLLKNQRIRDDWTNIVLSCGQLDKGAKHVQCGNGFTHFQQRPGVLRKALLQLNHHFVALHRDNVGLELNPAAPLDEFNCLTLVTVLLPDAVDNGHTGESELSETAFAGSGGSLVLENLALDVAPLKLEIIVSIAVEMQSGFVAEMFCCPNVRVSQPTELRSRHTGELLIERIKIGVEIVRLISEKLPSLFQYAIAWRLPRLRTRC